MNESLYKLIDIDIRNLHISLDQVNEPVSISEDYQCMMQFHIPQNPMQCSDCYSLICKGCLLDLQLRDNRCPNCRNILVPKEANRLAKNTLAKFMLRCLNPECKEIVKHEVYLNHYLTCQYTSREAQCTGCDISITTSNKLKEIEEHNKYCKLQKECKFCFKIFFFKDLDAHYELCEEREIACPYCYEKFSFSKISQHWVKQCARDIIKGKDIEIVNLENIHKEVNLKLLTLNNEIFNKENKLRSFESYENTLIRIKNICEKPKRKRDTRKALVETIIGYIHELDLYDLN
jgi:hypothetical protein